MSQYPPPPPGNYPAPPPGQYPGQPEYWQESPQRKGLAITTLVLGILAALSFWTVVGGVLFGLFAVIFGVIAVIKAMRGRAGGAVMAWIGLILGALAIVGAVIAGIVYWGFAEETGFTDFYDCVSQAGNDQAKIDQCEREWNQRIEDKIGITPTPAP
ncbi:DUF4190 domain-containing protein [Nocardia cyriacigeorgica]|uniref:DUF4190 domain-containing protein n=1 Tax=Nocardia cyriacigeorgica TaxID=135487 RepID=A0A5R8NSD6_9NOCA|nr:DUF4190 domain-containing protein [Nocardia cyriacigeorgica]TLF78610.1 DUF4190 domain-containing protein [Nocardia cyriacigeorgica]